MNKKVLVAIAIVALLLIGIGAYLMSQKKSATTTSNTPNTQVTQTPPKDTTPDFVKAMQGTGSVKCTYTNSDITTTTYIKDGKVRAESVVKGVTNNSIMVNKVVYLWMNNAKTGYMIDTSAVTTTVTPPAGGQNYKSIDSLKSELETYKPQCSTETIADSLFDKPAGVTFTDMSKLMNDIKSKIPANVTIPAGYQVPTQ